MPAIVYISAGLWVLCTLAVLAIIAWYTLGERTATDLYCSRVDDELDAAERRLAEALDARLERRRTDAIHASLNEIGFAADTTWSHFDLGGAA